MNILAIKMQENDACADTIGDYLKALLSKVWEDGEGFSGKRPFGNSGWEYELYKALVSSGAVEGKIDEWGDLGEFNLYDANDLISEAIEGLF